MFKMLSSALLLSSLILTAIAAGPSPSPTVSLLPPSVIAPTDKTQVKTPDERELEQKVSQFKKQKAAELALRKLKDPKLNCGDDIILKGPTFDRSDLNYVYDQANTGVCFAIAAATLIDFYRFDIKKSKSNFATSPLLLAIETSQSAKYFSKTDPRYSPYGGYPCETINWLSQQAQKSKPGAVKFPVQPTLSDQEKRAARDQSCFSFGKVGEFYEQCKFKNYSISQTVDSCQSRLNKAGENRTLSPEIKKTLKTLMELGATSDGFTAVLWEDFFSNLDLSEKIKSGLITEFKNLPRCSGVNVTSPKQGKDAIELYLDGGTPRPIIASIEAKMLNPLTEGRHAVTIIGKRFNREKKRCEYLIRNSWGNDPYTTKPQIEREPNGDLWIEQSLFLKNTFVLSTLDL